MFTCASVRERDRDQVASPGWHWTDRRICGEVKGGIGEARGAQLAGLVASFIHLFCSASLGCSIDVRFFHTSITYG
mgnify:CR=1